MVLEGIKSPERDVPDYIEADHNKMSAKLARVPALADVPYQVQMEPQLVVSFTRGSSLPSRLLRGQTREV